MGELGERVLLLPTNRCAAFCILLSFEAFHFGPALPPSIRIDLGSHLPESNLVNRIIFALPYDHQVYHHLFNSRIAAIFDPQTISHLPEQYTNLTTPFVDDINVPRCDNTKIFRVHFFHSQSLITGHILLSIFLLLASHSLHFQAHLGRRNVDFAYSNPSLSSGARGQGYLMGECRATKHVLVTIVLHCLVALILCLLHSLRLTISDSSLSTLLIPTSSWIEWERRGYLGTIWMGPSDSPLATLLPFYLINFLYALLIPLILHCLADTQTPLALASRGLSRLTAWWRNRQCRSCLEARAYPISFYIALTCIFISFVFHDGAAFLVIALALLLNCMSMLTKDTVRNDVDLKTTPMDGRLQILVAIQLRFALLLIFCSFLSVEQWFTFAFRAKVVFAGYKVNWLRSFQPTVFQFLLLLTTSMLLRSLPSPIVSIKDHRFRRLPPLLLALALLITLIGCLVCLGGYLHTADSLQTCLLITLATGFLLGLWVSLATTPFAVTAAMSCGQDHGHLSGFDGHYVELETEFAATILYGLEIFLEFRPNSAIYSRYLPSVGPFVWYSVANSMHEQTSLKKSFSIKDCLLPRPHTNTTIPPPITGNPTDNNEGAQTNVVQAVLDSLVLFTLAVSLFCAATLNTEKLTEVEVEIFANVGGEPIRITVGAGQIIAEWEDGLIGICEGERHRLRILSWMGYGDLIRTNSDLDFDIKNSEK
ncbi:FK506-binding protein [Echinococcus granulosus]|uniref:peptidylprolyl isomerase n=1 Tax=Echinococcus granulosus TaxID=6210 RepID=W6U3M5_ECHGR|nr:FK506-binding protein [Echinococcus granulosus]EUB55181.1 FK506-binding protein [Echinococcus granulosus]